MIGFSQLGRQGRLGNQLFQYAFVRALARQKGVSFFCPSWIGDSIFELRDEEERAREPRLPFNYEQPASECGYDAAAESISDGTDLRGYFQSPRYFRDPNAVRSWFSLRDPIRSRVEEKYAALALERCGAFHLRLGDFRHPLGRLRNYPVSLSYYSRNADLRSDAILVFSDEPGRARLFFRRFDGPPLIFVEGNRDYEDLYLMSRCRAIVGAASTFSWWGAWLNPRPDLVPIKKIVFPDRWFRRGYPCQATDLVPHGWHRDRVTRGPTYDYRVGHFFYRPAAWTWNHLPRSMRPSFVETT